MSLRDMIAAAVGGAVIKGLDWVWRKLRRSKVAKVVDEAVK